jgi:nucleotide-binding universal stress UspA family protein
MSISTIVVGYDHTDPSKHALERASEIAKAFGAKIVVTSVAPLLHSSPRAAAAGPADPLDNLTHHEEELAEAKAVLDGQGIEVELVPAIGEPASAIVQLAEQRDADLVVVGTREVGVIQRVLGQSVSQEIARRIHRDVLIVHPARSTRSR